MSQSSSATVIQLDRAARRREPESIDPHAYATMAAELNEVAQSAADSAAALRVAFGELIANIELLQAASGPQSTGR
jgi:hypothetical protein